MANRKTRPAGRPPRGRAPAPPLAAPPLAAALLLAGAALLGAAALLPAPAGAQEAGALLLLDPEAPMAAPWKTRGFGGPQTLWEPGADAAGAPCLRATAEGGGASGRILRLEGGGFEAGARPVLEWEWTVDRLPPGGDPSDPERDDFGAVVHVLFGPAGPLRRPPTLAYAWAGGAAGPGSVIESPRHPSVRIFVLRGAESPDGRLARERRDLAADFRRAFGEAPRLPVSHVALWTDADQTGGPASACYGALRSLAPEAP